VTFDLEGAGLSPSSNGAPVSIDGFSKSVREVLDFVGAKEAVVVGHSMGGLIANTFAASYPARVSKLFLIGPAKAPSQAVAVELTARAQTVLEGGMSSIIDVAASGISQKTQTSRPLAKAAIRATLLSTPPKGYSAACLALAKAVDPDYSKITSKTVILAGSEDKVTPPDILEFFKRSIVGSEVMVLEDVGHWHLLEDVEGTAKALISFIL